MRDGPDVTFYTPTSLCVNNLIGSAVVLSETKRGGMRQYV